MKDKYDINSFISNFKDIIMDAYGVDAINANYVINPVYDSSKNETGEDSVFRLVILSEKNIGDKKLSFDDTVCILTAFEAHYPTKIIISEYSSERNNIFEIFCSTRVRKPSAISNIYNRYAPFEIKK